MHPGLVLLAGIVMQAVVPAATPDVGQESKAKAQVLLKEGTVLYEQGDYAGALEKFEAAYGVYPSPKLQFNIGQANRDLGRPVEALMAFDRFLSEAKGTSPDARADAERSAADLRAKLGRVRIVCPIAGAEVTLDGKAVGVTPVGAPIWSTPGHHQLTARAGDLAPAIEDFDVSPGQTSTVTLALKARLPSARPPVARPAVSIVSAPHAAEATPLGAEISARREKSPPYRALFWSGVAATVASGLTAILAWSSATDRFDSLQNTCGRTSAGCSGPEIDPVKSRVLIANIMWVIAGTAAAATGVVVYLNVNDPGAALAWHF
jgi:hypothetical protein